MNENRVTNKINNSPTLQAITMVTDIQKVGRFHRRMLHDENRTIFFSRQNRPIFAWQTTDFCLPLLLADKIGQLCRSSEIGCVQQQMKNQRVPKYVRWRMVKYYCYLWTYNKGVPTKSLFVDLPVPMRAEIAVAVTKPMWTKVGLVTSVIRRFSFIHSFF